MLVPRNKKTTEIDHEGIDLHTKITIIISHSEQHLLVLVLLQFTCGFSGVRQWGRRPRRCGRAGGEAAAGVIGGINLAAYVEREKKGEEWD